MHRRFESAKNKNKKLKHANTSGRDLTSDTKAAGLVVDATSRATKAAASTLAMTYAVLAV